MARIRFLQKNPVLWRTVGLLMIVLLAAGLPLIYPELQRGWALHQQKKKAFMALEDIEQKLEELCDEKTKAIQSTIKIQSRPQMSLQAICTKKNTSVLGCQHKNNPSLLRNVKVDHVDQAWAADIRYVPMRSGFMYLTAIMDWHSRYVLSWELSNTLDSSFCVSALEYALQQGKPDIFSTEVLLGSKEHISRKGLYQAYWEQQIS